MQRLTSFVAAPLRSWAQQRALAIQPRRPFAQVMSTAGATPPVPGSDLVQYVVVRTDLGWGTGALIAQGIHAAVAATHGDADCAHTKAYVAPSTVGQMTTLVLAASSAKALEDVAASLSGAGIRHELWREQPEDIPTALAARPGPRQELKPFFRKFKLLR